VGGQHEEQVAVGNGVFLVPTVLRGNAYSAVKRGCVDEAQNIGNIQVFFSFPRSSVGMHIVRLNAGAWMKRKT